MARQEYIRTREGSNIAKIVVDRELCISAASCVAVADTTYELDEESKAIVLDPNKLDDEALIQSAQVCPTLAILLFDKDDNQIFP